MTTLLALALGLSTLAHAQLPLGTRLLARKTTLFAQSPVGYRHLTMARGRHLADPFTAEDYRRFAADAPTYGFDERVASDIAVGREPSICNLSSRVELPLEERVFLERGTVLTVVATEGADVAYLTGARRADGSPLPLMLMCTSPGVQRGGDSLTVARVRADFGRRLLVITDSRAE